MIRKIICLALYCSAVTMLYAQPIITVFEKSKGAETPAYHEIIDWWKALDKRSALVQMRAMGATDAGYPLHLITVSANGEHDIAAARKKGNTIILVNNGIHPGEPDGIDASMLLVRDIVEKKYTLPPGVLLCIVPVYNIGGCLNRSPDYRVDQNGPAEFGSRGNSQNLDLNRDFIKADSKEALSFAALFRLTDPDIFVDNHVSNGADYQHVMTLLSSQHNRVGGAMGEYLQEKFEPALYALMKQKGFDLVPYVNHWSDKKVEEGWQQFWDSPRYGSGYGTLWSSFSFVPETHMLKPYPQRVAATRALMESFISYAAQHGTEIRRLRAARREENKKAAYFPIRWQWDSTKQSSIRFLGYESGYKKSEVSGLPRLYYDRNKPYERQISFYNSYYPVDSVKAPLGYVLPQGWWKVVERLKANNVVMRPLQRDTVIEVEVYRIAQYQAGGLYEGHYPLSKVEIKTSRQKISFRKGDWYIPMNQEAARFLIETLEPQAEDSYFTWNCFDPILRQKEGFSDYAFEDIAAEYLRQHPEAGRQLEEARQKDEKLAKSAYLQLQYVFRQSPYLEPGYMRYPVYRITK